MQQKEEYNYRNNILHSTNKWIDEGENVVLFEVKNPWFENIISKEDVELEIKQINTNSDIITNNKINKKYRFNSIICIMILIIFILVCIRVYTRKKKLYHK